MKDKERTYDELMTLHNEGRDEEITEKEFCRLITKAAKMGAWLPERDKE